MRESAGFTGLVLKGCFTDLVLYFHVVDRFKKNDQALGCIDRNILIFKLDLHLTLEVNGSHVGGTMVLVLIYRSILVNITQW